MRSHRRTKAWLLAVIFCLILGAAASWLLGSFAVRGHPSTVPASAPPARDFFLTTDDGLRIAATYRPGARPRAPAVLLLHGVDGSRTQTAANARWLSAQGYATLAIDFRGHGQSDQSARSFGFAEAADAAAAFRWLKRRQGGAPVAIVGISLGGAASLLGPDGPIRADALVLQAVYPSLRQAIYNRIASRAGALPAYALEPLLSFQSRPRFGVWPSRIAPIDALRRYRGPVLIIGGMDDSATPPDESRAMFDAAAGPKRLLLVPGKNHDAITNDDDPAYRAELLRFLRQTIGR